MQWYRQWKRNSFGGSSRTLGENIEQDSKNVSSVDKIFPGGKIITLVFLLSSRIPNKNALDRSMRKFV